MLEPNILPQGPANSFQIELDKQIMELRRLVLSEVQRLQSVNAVELDVSEVKLGNVKEGFKPFVEASPRQSVNDSAPLREAPSLIRSEKKQARKTKRGAVGFMPFRDDSPSPIRTKLRSPKKTKEQATEKTLRSDMPSDDLTTVFGNNVEACASQSAPQDVSLAQEDESLALSAHPSNWNVPAMISKAITPGVQPDEPIVVASCPESLHDEVMDICNKRNFAKAYGKKGDMVDLLSGDNWVGKWEAKVVVCAVTKAKDMNANNVRIICIQGGPHCDKEMAAQPRLKKAIKQEFRDDDFRIGVEWLTFEEFREKYDMQGPVLATRIFLCCKKSNSLEAVFTLKRELELWLPMAAVCLDLDDLGGDKAWQDVFSSTHFVLFLTRGAISDIHVQCQIRCAIQYKKPMIIVMDTDSRYGVADLSALLEDANDDIKPVFTNNIAIPWSSDREAQMACLEKISSMISPSEVQASSDLRSGSGELVFGANGELVLDPFFAQVCSWAAIYLPGSSTKVRIWSRVNFASLFFLSFAQVTMMFGDLERNYYFRDWRDHIFFIIVPLLMICIPYEINRLFRTNAFADMITKYARDKNMASQLRVFTRKCAWIFLAIMILAGIACLIGMAYSWIYVKRHQGSVLWSISTTVCVIVFVPQWVFQLNCFFVLAHVIFSVVLMDFASSFQDLHPQIKDLGIKESVEHGIIVHVRDSDFVRFQTTIHGSIRRANCLLRSAAWIFFAIFATWIVNFVLQAFYSFKFAMYGPRYHTNEKFSLLVARTFAPLLADVAILGPLVYLRSVQLKTGIWAERLIFTKFSSRVAVLSIARDVELCATVGLGKLRVSHQSYLIALFFVRIVLWLLELLIYDFR